MDEVKLIEERTKVLVRQDGADTTGLSIGEVGEGDYVDFSITTMDMKLVYKALKIYFGGE